MTKNELLNNSTYNKNIYYCTNHRINTSYKKTLYKNNPCKGRIE